MNQTSNYSLNQWDSTDRIMMEDFNADNAKTDAALGELSAALTAQETALAAETAAREAALALKGDCQIYAASYTGTGTYGAASPNTLTFPDQPILILIKDLTNSLTTWMIQGATHTLVESTGYNIMLTWSGNSVSWYSAANATVQLNTSGQNHLVVAFCKKG